MAANMLPWDPVSLLIITLYLSFFLPICLCDHEPTDFVSCLIHQNIKNFSMYPDADHTVSSINYYQLLNFSIQNLRFAGPSVPKPSAIIVPSSKEQLISTVICCKRESLEIRVRCGGHSYEGTSSVVSDGTPFVIIDMMNLNQILVDLDGAAAWVEGGATLGQTYHAIAQSSNVHGFSAGSCPTVGIGGHIAGGGFGLLSRKYGLAADNVVDALLIDADGRLLDREAMGEDVFWAIRGGGGGIWGIVFAWKIQLSRVPKTITGFIVSRRGPKDYVANLVHKWQFVAPKLEDEFYLSVFIGAGLPEADTVGNISATFKGFYQGRRRKAVSVLKKVFPELGIAGEDCNEMSWIESVLYFSGLGNGSKISDLSDRYLWSKGYFKGKSDYVRSPISISGIKAAVDVLEKEPKGYLILDPYGGIMERISSNSIAFPHREGNLFTIQYLVEWKGEENEKSSKEYIEWIRGFYDSMTPYVSMGPRAAYINYVDLDLGVMESVQLLQPASDDDDAVETARIWGQKYFLGNYDRLVRAKTLIDPHNIFKNEQGIPPLSLPTRVMVMAE